MAGKWFARRRSGLLGETAISRTLLIAWSTEALLWRYHKSRRAVIEAVKSVFTASEFRAEGEMIAVRKANETWNSSLQSPQTTVKEDQTSARLGSR